jgi:spore maturation protein CgeB
MRQPKILIIGSKKKYSLEKSYQRAFKSLGVKKICFFSNDLYFYLYTVLSSLKLNFLYFFISFYLKKNLNSFLRKIKSIDIIIIFKGMELNKEDLVKLRTKYPASKIINIYTDDPYNMSSPATSSDLLLDLIPVYDFFFIWSKKIRDKLKKNYNFYKNFYYLPFGYDSFLHEYTKKKIDKKYISFIASGDNYRENFLKKINKYKINIFGNSWGLNSTNHVVRRFVHGLQLSRIISESFISINILRKQNQGSHNMKTFEIPAMGGLLVTTRSYEQNVFFPENKASVMFSNAKELQDKIDFLLNNEKIAMKIRNKGFELSKKHSYINRAKYLLNIIWNPNAQ